MALVTHRLLVLVFVALLLAAVAAVAEPPKDWF